MSKAVASFLDRRSFDAQDQLAKRALRALSTLTALVHNAYDRGDQPGFIECTRGADCALHAFACINSQKGYDFANDVHQAVGPLSEAFKDIVEASKFAGSLVDQAEGVIHALKDKLTPVCTVSGVSSVAILRGAHCEAAFAGLGIANDR